MLQKRKVENDRNDQVVIEALAYKIEKKLQKGDRYVLSTNLQTEVEHDLVTLVSDYTGQNPSVLLNYLENVIPRLLSQAHENDQN